MFQFRQFRRRCALIAASAALGAASAAGAQITADEVVAYEPGTVQMSWWGEPYTNAPAALGLPNPTHDFDHPDFPDHTLLTPFSPAFNTEHIVGVGAGGSLTLRLSSIASTTGPTIGVHAGVGLADGDWPNGQNLPQAATFTSPRIAEVSVSLDNDVWTPLGLIEFNLPSNYYAEGVTNPATQTEPGTLVADFGKPFTAELSDFDGQDWAGTLAVLDGSAGGTWLDLSSVDLPGVRYIRFDVPAGSEDVMFVDAMVAIPEPASVLLIGSCALLMRRRRRRHE